MIQVNEYFEGTVKSLGYDSPEGKSTIGVMEKGDYEFGTSTEEKMIVIEGTLEVQLPSQMEWKTYEKGQSFDVPANVSFKVKALRQTSYLCKYGK